MSKRLCSVEVGVEVLAARLVLALFALAEVEVQEQLGTI
jgi:hypothetical protein